MHSQYQVIWTNVAENDLKDIIEYISWNNPLNALNILKKIRKKASDLYTLPERSRIVPELKEQGILQYRELIVSPWRIVYRIAKQKIFVLSVMDSRRNIEDLLLTRLIFKNQNSKLMKY